MPDQHRSSRRLKGYTMVYDRWLQELSQMPSLPLPYRIHFLVAAWMAPCSDAEDAVTFQPGEMRRLLTSTDPETGEMHEPHPSSLSKALVEARRLGLITEDSTIRRARINPRAVRPCLMTDLPPEPMKPKKAKKDPPAVRLHAVGG